MTAISLGRIATATIAATALLAGAAFAHHGWEWAVGEQSTLEGAIRDIYLGQPHATLKVEAAGGMVWAVDLAPPAATARAGFVKGVAAVGDQVIVLGNRAKDADEKRMKAVRLTVNGKNYDVYPDRVKAP
jgi:hypothetical protein